MNAVKMIRAGLTFVAMLGMLLGALMSGVSAQGQEVCGPLDSGKIDTVEGVDQAPTLMLTAPDGFLISGYCVKAGAEASMPDGVTAVQYVDVEPPVKSITISHSTGKDISHYSYSLVEEPAVNEWCSPGYWKNNTSMWPASVSIDATYASTVGPLYVKVKGVDQLYSDQNTSLLSVLQNPSIFGGEQTNLVADYLSEAHPEINFTGERYIVVDGIQTHDCPLEGDGNQG